MTADSDKPLDFEKPPATGPAERDSAPESAATGSPEDKALAKKLKHRAKWKLFWVVSALSLIADQVTKIWARESLPTFPLGPDKSYVCQIPTDVIPGGNCGAEAVPVIESFWHWRLSMNQGSAFGLFSKHGDVGRWLLSLVGIGAVIGMVWMLRKSRADQRILHWALALVAGGAVGNLIDRIYYGVVTDFILWHWGTTPARQGVQHHFATEWPVFNIADVVLVVGVLLMALDIQKEGKRDKEKKKRRQEKARAAGLIKDM